MLKVILICSVFVLRSIALLDASEESFTVYRNCEFIETDWADGDSFPVWVLEEDGTRREMTVRLYGADCMEVNLANDESNARRFREQARYFGIPNPLAARSMGEAAKATVKEILREPFTIFTVFADGRGDPRYPRYYAFVSTNQGKDLSEFLVEEGLARAHGVFRSRPDGTRKEDWQEKLEDLELLAAKRGRGSWALTDWDRLPELRQEIRDEEAEIDELVDPSPPAGYKIDPNSAARDELLSLPGIGESLALRIIEERPYRSLDDLVRVPGIGPKTLEQIREYLELSGN